MGAISKVEIPCHYGANEPREMLLTCKSSRQLYLFVILGTWTPQGVKHYSINVIKN